MKEGPFYIMIYGHLIKLRTLKKMRKRMFDKTMAELFLEELKTFALHVLLTPKSTPWRKEEF